MLREIIFDTETTGLSPARGDRLVEIGCIELVDRRETGRSFHAYFNPERDMPPEAEAVHGLSAQFLAGKPLFADRAEQLLDFIGDAPLVAHNAAFDFGFLNAELARARRLALGDDRMICTVQMARRRFPGSKHSLDALCVRYGIDRTHRVKHGALLDAELLVQVYIELTGGRQIGLGLADAAIGTELAPPPPGTTVPATPPMARQPRFAAVSADDLARHQQFLTELGLPNWMQSEAPVPQR